MTKSIKDRALALINEKSKRGGFSGFLTSYPSTFAFEVICDLIEEHDAFRRTVSDTVVNWFGGPHRVPGRKWEELVLPEEDPVRRVLRMTMSNVSEQTLRAKLMEEGLMIVEKPRD